VDNDILTSLKAADIRFVRVLWCDNANVIRAKAVHSGALPRFSKDGLGISAAQMAIPVMYDAVVPDTGLGPVGEIRLVPDWNSITGLPYANGHARVMGDMILNGKPWAFCPRDFLKRMAAEASRLGVEVEAAFENEFYLLSPEDGGLLPADDTVFAATRSMDAAHDVIDEIASALLAQDIPVELYHPESGPGQHEISVRHTNALRAADRQIAFRETVHAVAMRYSLKASFLPKIFEDKAGNGCHLHLSLWQSGHNVLSGGTQDRHGLSARGRAFMAGVLQHLPALMAVTTPSCNSYRRLQPNSWAGAFRCWGMDNREAALRVPSVPDGPPTNFELKTVDASSNPYLALGVVIAAGLAGVAQELDLPEPVDRNPADLSEADRTARHIDRLPKSLGESLKHFRKDKVLLAAMGNELHTAFGAVRKAEYETLKGLALDEEVELLLERY
jgi:glutamine synthetase